MAFAICTNCNRLQALFKIKALQNKKILSVGSLLVENRSTHYSSPWGSIGTGIDRNPKHLQHIYYGTLTPQIKAVKVSFYLFSLAYTQTQIHGK